MSIVLLTQDYIFAEFIFFSVIILESFRDLRSVISSPLLLSFFALFLLLFTGQQQDNICFTALTSYPIQHTPYNTRILNFEF